MPKDKYDTARSVRVPDTRWNRAKRRATYEGTDMSKVINAFLEGYGGGQINLPVVKVVYARPAGGETDAHSDAAR